MLKRLFIVIFVSAAVLVCFYASRAEARGNCQYLNNGRVICPAGAAQRASSSPRKRRVARSSHRRRAAPAVHYDASGNRATIIGGRPAGCPHRYCGCGLRKYLGIADKRLNLAVNWLRIFPRTSPAPGMVAARSGHVFYLISHVGGARWLVRDYNSGRGLSRIHVRSVRGYGFVNPHGTTTYHARRR